VHRFADIARVMENSENQYPATLNLIQDTVSAMRLASNAFPEIGSFGCRAGILSQPYKGPPEVGAQCIRRSHAELIDPVIVNR
jgi:hypothetical protein